MSRRRNQIRYAGLSALVLIFVVSLAVSFRAVIVQQNQGERDVFNVQWISSNLAIEHSRLLATLADYARDEPLVTAETLTLRLDLFWSRLSLFVEGEFGALFGTIEGVHELIGRQRHLLEQLAPQITALRPGDRDAYLAVREQLEAFRAPIHDLVLKTTFVLDAVKAIQTEGLRKAYMLLAISLIGILVSGSLLISFLVLELNRTQRAEAAATEARAQAEHASRAKSDFLAHMSHELRTPLNAIIGFSKIIEQEMMGPLGTDRYREYALDIGSSGLHLLSLINDILDLSRIEAGRMELNETELDLSEILQSCYQLLRERAGDHKIHMTCLLQPNLPPICADARAIKQIVINLLSNAIRYTEDGGQVDVKAAIDAEGDVEISISDSGIGMAPNEIEFAFAPFQQIGNLLTRKYHGSGLGLPLAKHLTELHSGRMQLTSAPGVGTTVQVILPRWRLGDASLAA